MRGGAAQRQAAPIRAGGLATGRAGRHGALGRGAGAVEGRSGFSLFVVVSLVATSALWWCTAWFMLEGEVRWRVLIPTGLITGLAMWGYTIAATIWMPDVVTRNETQFGFFGVALALVTWLSGAAICILVGACAGSVLAEDNGPVGTFVRGRRTSTLVRRRLPPSRPPIVSSPSATPSPRTKTPEPAPAGSRILRDDPSRW